MQYPIDPINGLNDRQIEEMRRRYGSNELPHKPGQSFWRHFLAAFGDPIIKILMLALGANLLLLLRGADWYEPVGIAAAVFLATFVSTVSEYGSEAAFLKLQEEAARTSCRVRRNGKVRTLPIGELVPGDVVLLEAGDKVPADGVMLSGLVRVDQSALSGESREETKRPGSMAEPQRWDLGDGRLVYRGSVVTEGEAAMVVGRVGQHTFLGGMAAQLQEQVRQSPLKVRLEHLAGALSRMGYLAAALVALADLFQGIVMQNGFDPVRIVQSLSSLPFVLEQLLHAATLSITVVVVAVPEGLPMMITLVLSANMLRMQRDNVMVRKLVGIETAGSLNILFTDKTGTLTRGRPTVAGIVGGDGKSIAPGALRSMPLWGAVALGCRANTASSLTGGRAVGGNMTDRVLLELAGDGAPEPVAERLPFDSRYKYSAVRLQSGTVLVKGAPDRLMPCCRFMLDPGTGQQRPFSPAAVQAAVSAAASEGMRVICLAQGGEMPTPERLPQGMTFVAAVLINDEPRPEAARAVQEALGAGVQVVMMTGDSRETAAAIARRCGILGVSAEGVFTGEQLRSMTDDEVRARMKDLRVVARSLPEDKSRLVRLAQKNGLVTGMTGDGVNDAPALKLADVGFAMGSGTEVAREASDIVILDGNFRSITRAIRYGRTLFLSIRKFVVFQLTMNLCAVGVSVVAPLLGVDAPVTVMQMLWINIIMDTLAGLAFAGEPASPGCMREKPKRRDEPVLGRYEKGKIAAMGGITVAMCLLFLKLPFFRGLYRPHPQDLYFMTGFFTFFVFCGLFNAFNARAVRLNMGAGLFKNPFFLPVMGLAAVVQTVLIYFGGSLFRTAPLTPRELLTSVALALFVIPLYLVVQIYRQGGRLRRVRVLRTMRHQWYDNGRNLNESERAR